MIYCCVEPSSALALCQQDLHLHTQRCSYISWPCMHSQICTTCNRNDEHTYVLQSHYEMPPAGTDQGKNKLCNDSPRKGCVSCAMCVCVCLCVFCVHFCPTHELHPVLIKASCSFYIITVWRMPSADSLIISVVCCSTIWLQAHSPPCYSFLLLSFPL